MNLFSTLIGLFLVSQMPFHRFDPQAEWRTYETEHFLIHYHEEVEEPANRLARFVEPVYGELTQEIQWEPEAKTHIVLSDHQDSSNGMAIPLPYNTLYLNTRAPNSTSSLDYYDDWLLMLFVHEFTHTLHIDMAEGWNHILRRVLGRIVLPNAIKPQWFTEGLAIYQETKQTTGGRGRSPFIDMYLRTAALHNQLTPIDRASYWNQVYPYGNAAYWEGMAFLQYLEERFGEEKMTEFTQLNARWIVPSFFNFKTREIYGTSFSRLWDEWRESERQYWQELTKQYPSQYHASIIAPELRLLGSPAWHPQKREFYAAVRKKPHNYLMRFYWTEEEGWEHEALFKGVAPANLHYHDGKLLYSKYQSLSSYETSFDLFEFSLESEKETQLTKGLRLRSPIQIEDSIYAVRTKAMKSSLVKFERQKNGELVSSEDALQFLWEAPGFSTLDSLAASPDGQQIAFSMLREYKSRDLYLYDRSEEAVRELTQDPYWNYFPSWSENGQWIVYSTDREFGETEQQVFNAYALHLESKQEVQLTDSWTGVYWPQIRDSSLVHGRYGPEGFQLHELQLQEHWQEGPSKPQQKASLSELKREPPILKDQATSKNEVAEIEQESSEYRVRDTLLPRYVLPFYYYSETDSLVGAQTGSHDPLTFHAWSAFAFHFLSPNRPGGGVHYLYRGFDKFDLGVQANSQIINYGQILIVPAVGPEGEPGLAFSRQDYYERIHQGALSVHYETEWPFRLFHHQEVSLRDRSSLLKLPSDVVFPPEEIRQWNFLSRWTWRSGFKETKDGISPQKGQSLRFSFEYSPPMDSSSVHQLTTTLTGRHFWEFLPYHSLALYGVYGQQWLDAIFQPSFRLGGSRGESLFHSINLQAFPLRGLPSGALQAEGLVLGSAEYRFPIMRLLPGFGTAPIWFKNIHMGIFQDTGQVFQFQDSEIREIPNFSWQRFSWSSGLELKSDVSLSYAPPVTFRLGYGRVLALQGDWVAQEGVDEFYIQIGHNF